MNHAAKKGIFAPESTSLAAGIFFVLAQKILLILLLIFFSQFTLAGILTLRDGGGYLNIARGFLSGSFVSVPPEDTQYFAGYPLLLAFFQRFLPAWAAVYLIQFSCLAGSLWFGQKLFPGTNILLWTLFCVPSSVLFTSLNMSESLILFLFLGMLFTHLSGRPWLCAFLAGFALVTRPQGACFLYLVLLFRLFRLKKFRGLVLMILIPAVFLSVMHGFNAAIFGNVFHNYALYAAHESAEKFLNVPLSGLLTFTAHPDIRIVNKIHILGLTAFLAAGFLLLWRKFCKGEGDSAQKILFAAGFFQFLFLLSLNSRWAFLELPRYFILLFPAAFLGVQKILPKSRWAIFAVGAAAVLIAFYAEASGNRYAH
jgi:hypothetical protein